MSAAFRAIAREAAVQTFFECEFREDVSVEETLPRNIAALSEKIHAEVDSAFAEKLVVTAFERLSSFKESITLAAVDFPYEKISRLDRAILVLALAEREVFGGEIPLNVTLDEYIEMAKQYGGDNSRRFVNGVLGSVVSHD